MPNLVLTSAQRKAISKSSENGSQKAMSRPSASAKWCHKKKLICKAAVSQTQRGNTACTWTDDLRCTLAGALRAQNLETSSNSVVENPYLLAQMRQPGRSIYSDLTPSTFSGFLKILLNKRNFNFKKEVDGQLLSQPCWAHCLFLRTRIAQRSAQEVPYDDNGHHRSMALHLRRQ